MSPSHVWCGPVREAASVRPVAAPWASSSPGWRRGLGLGRGERLGALALVDPRGRGCSTRAPGLGTYWSANDDVFLLRPRPSATTMATIARRFLSCRVLRVVGVAAVIALGRLGARRLGSGAAALQKGAARVAEARLLPGPRVAAPICRRIAMCGWFGRRRPPARGSARGPSRARRGDLPQRRCCYVSGPCLVREGMLCPGPRAAAACSARGSGGAALLEPGGSTGGSGRGRRGETALIGGLGPGGAGRRWRSRGRRRAPSGIAASSPRPSPRPERAPKASGGCGRTGRHESAPHGEAGPGRRQQASAP